MNDEPSLTTPLKNLMVGLAEQDPEPILDGLAFFAKRAVSESELLEFVSQAPPNDPGMTQLRLALGKWDASEDLKLLDAHGAETGSGTIARRIAVVRELGL